MTKTTEFSAVELSEYDDNQDEADLSAYNDVGLVAGEVSEERYRRAQMAVSLLSVALFGAVLFVFLSLWTGQYVFILTDEESPSRPTPSFSPSSSPSPAPSPSSFSLPTGGLTETELDELARQVKSAMDYSIDPCDDFYMYSCGSWLEENVNATATYPSPSPSSSPLSWSKSFDQMELRNEEKLKKIIVDQRWPLLETFYDSCMDMDTRNTLGIKPVIELLEYVKQMDMRLELGAFVGELHNRGVDVLFKARVYPDLIDPKMNILHMDQGGMGMNPDHYWGSSEKDGRMRRAYYDYIVKLFLESGWKKDFTSASISSDKAGLLEEAMAKKALSTSQQHDIYANYHLTPLSDFLASVGDASSLLNWDAYFHARGIDKHNITMIDVVAPEFFSNMIDLISDRLFDTVENYLAFHILSSSASRLTSAFLDIQNEFHAEAYDYPMYPSLEESCLSWTKSVLGDLIGRYYVREVFDERSKDIATDMIHSIENAFVENLPRVEWMDESTRRAAQDKITKITNRIGYPEKWRDYENLILRPNQYWTNVDQYFVMQTEENIAELGTAVDMQKWGTPPHHFIASYNNLANEIVFSAAALQPTFFNARWPLAMNYGGVGVVMGHELTHGFDDYGRQFNGDGQLEQQWSSSVEQGYDNEASCIADLYSSFTVLLGDGDELNVKGYLTLLENMADIGGVRLAFSAMQEKLLEAKQSQQKQYEKHKKQKEEKQLEAEVHWPVYSEELLQDKFGIGSEELFFLAMAQSSCTVYGDEFLRQSILNDRHSPARYRTNGPLSQLGEFGRAYGCAEGSRMRPKDTCSVW